MKESLNLFFTNAICFTSYIFEAKEKLFQKNIII